MSEASLPVRGFLSFDEAPRGRAASASSVLMRAHHRRVDTGHPIQLTGGIGVSLHRGEHPGPGAVARPPVQPLPRRLPRPETLRQIPPRRPGPIPPRDRLDHLPMLTPPATATRRPIRQQRLDPRPRHITEHTSPGHERIVVDTPANIRETRPRRDTHGAGFTTAQAVTVETLLTLGLVTVIMCT